MAKKNAKNVNRLTPNQREFVRLQRRISKASYELQEKEQLYTDVSIIYNPPKRITSAYLERVRKLTKPYLRYHSKTETGEEYKSRKVRKFYTQFEEITPEEVGDPFGAIDYVEQDEVVDEELSIIDRLYEICDGATNGNVAEVLKRILDKAIENEGKYTIAVRAKEGNADIELATAVKYASKHDEVMESAMNFIDIIQPNGDSKQYYEEIENALFRDYTEHYSYKQYNRRRRYYKSE